MAKPLTFLQAVKLIGQRQPVQCTMKGCKPVAYAVNDDELTVDGKIYDIRDFCFSPSQILSGKWRRADRG